MRLVICPAPTPHGRLEIHGSGVAAKRVQSADAIAYTMSEAMVKPRNSGMMVPRQRQPSARIEGDGLFRNARYRAQTRQPLTCGKDIRSVFAVAEDKLPEGFYRPSGKPSARTADRNRRRRPVYAKRVRPSDDRLPKEESG